MIDPETKKKRILLMICKKRKSKDRYINKKIALKIKIASKILIMNNQKLINLASLKNRTS